MAVTAEYYAPETTDPPAPKGYPVLGVLPHIRRNPLQFFVTMARDLGDVVALDLGPHKALMVNRPDYVRHVLLDNHANYHKSQFYGPLRPLFGDGLITSEDDEWLQQRLTASKQFQGPRLRSMSRGMTDAVDAMLDRWETDVLPTGRNIDVCAEMTRLTLDVLFRCLFGLRLHGEHERIYEALTAVLEDAERRIWAMIPVPTWAPTKNNREARVALHALEECVARIIEERRNATNQEPDLLSVLIDTGGGGKEPSAKLLRDQLLTILMAGHETTANALTWTWYLLSTHPEVYRRMKEEVDNVLGDRTPTFEDLSSLVYTRMVLDESMRLYPPVWTVSRMAMDDDSLGSIPVPSGTTVMVCPYAIHRRQDLWRNPEGFDPERFAPGTEKDRHRFAFLPFGAGPRTCLGNHFAIAEGVLALARVAQRFRLEMVPGQTVEPEPMITLRPREALRMVLSPASGGESRAATPGAVPAPLAEAGAGCPFHQVENRA